MYDKETFSEVVKPVIAWLNQNANPHAKIIISVVDAELFTAEICFDIPKKEI